VEVGVGKGLVWEFVKWRRGVWHQLC